VLLAALTTEFQQQVQASPTIPQSVKAETAKRTEGGLAMISQADAEKVVEDAGVSKATADEVLDYYADAQVLALKTALFVASIFVLVGAWFARALPNRPLDAAPDVPAEEAPEAGVWAPPEDTGAPVGDVSIPARE
jgi:hypothetical protein